MNPALIDTHSHLHFAAYDVDREHILEQMRERNIVTITVGTNRVTSEGAVRLAESSQLVFASIGYHPSHMAGVYDEGNEAADPEPFRISALREISLLSKRIVAIGETGLDYTYVQGRSDAQEQIEEQKQVFSAQIDLASELNLPLIIHARETFDDIRAIIRTKKEEGKRVRAVIHCFSGTWADAERLLQDGFMLSFTGLVTYKPKKHLSHEDHLQRVVERIPIDRMMIETDAPWLAPEPNRGKRNDPTMVEQICRSIAQQRHESMEYIKEQTVLNAIAFFSLPV